MRTQTLLLLAGLASLPGQGDARRPAQTKPAGTEVATPTGAGKAEDEAAAEQTEERRKRSIGADLSQRIRAVTGQVFTSEGRFVVGPQLAGSLNDPFYQNLQVGLAAGYYILESLYIGAQAEYVPLNLVTTNVRVLGREEPRPAYYRPQYFAYLDLAWAPFFGKLSLLAERVAHFNLELHGGVGVAQLVSGRDDVSNPPLRLSGLIGIGGHFFVNDWSALRWMLSDRLLYDARYIASRPGTEELSLLHFLCLTIGYDFYVP